MSVSFDVATSTGSYSVSVVPGALAATLAEPGERVYIVDAFLAPQVRAAGVDPIVIRADESAKSLDRMTGLIEQMRDRRATRNSVLVAVGGGVVQDAAAFVASVYMRWARLGVRAHNPAEYGGQLHRREIVDQRRQVQEHRRHHPPASAGGGRPARRRDADRRAARRGAVRGGENLPVSRDMARSTPIWRCALPRACLSKHSPT